MIEDNIYRDYVRALKEKDRQKSEFLSFVRAELKNKAISLKRDKLGDSETISVLKKQQKRLRDSRESVANSGRNELAAAVERELSIISAYLPDPLTDEQLSEIVDRVISSLENPSPKDMGKVMKAVLAEAGARADAKTISVFVKEKLSA